MGGQARRFQQPFCPTVLVVLAAVAGRSGVAYRLQASPDQVLDWQRALWRDGHVELRDVLPMSNRQNQDVVEEILIVGKRIIQRCARCPHADDVHDADCRGCHRHRATSGPKSFNKARNLHRQSPTITRLVNSGDFIELAAGLLGVRQVSLYQTALFDKELGDVESGWHQDSAAIPLDTDHVVTIWVALNDLDQDSGTLTFANASHRGMNDGLSSRKVKLTNRVASIRHLTDNDVKEAYTVVPPRSIHAGDATAHLGWTFHRAPPNTAQASRAAFAVTYYATGARTHRDLIAPPGSTVANGRARGVELQTLDGVIVVVQLLSDDLSTWMPWMMDGRLVPGEPLQIIDD